MSESEYALLFSLSSSFGYKKILVLKNHFGSLQAAWNNSDWQEWQQLGFVYKEIKKHIELKKDLDAQKVFSDLVENNVGCVTCFDDDYPSLLKEIYSRPLVLYYQGEIELANRRGLAVVGTRKITDYGRMSLSKIIPDLVAKNLVIVSGLAYGVDSTAHAECLQAGGMTIAVLAGGIDCAIHGGNHKLYQRILKNGGLILTEYGLGVAPKKYFFPARNRIVSGISEGVLVVEAPNKSGALITANFALEQNRSVMALPGGIHQTMSSGCNQLIKNGALLVCDVDDILLELGIEVEAATIVKVAYKPENTQEEKIIKVLKDNDLVVDEIALKVDFSIGVLLSTLNILAVKGVVKEMPGGMWTIVK